MRMIQAIYLIIMHKEINFNHKQPTSSGGVDDDIGT
jgi:hypothetical protein